ncbi:MAG TPA: SpoIID/LytB domain-containing protein [Candidatus Angelobacter sp.]|jgi:stage II sporulation protein D|nr:SpoIID/LytB domain-containing protein [Candidatus Angelobacter sp.]
MSFTTKSFIRTAKSKSSLRPLGLLCALCGELLIWCSVAFSQGTELTVRLYSLHPEQRLKLEAATGHLEWRSCEKCQRNSAHELSIEASGQELKITGENHAGLEQLFVEGSYRLEPEQGFKLTLSFPVHIKADHGLLLVLATVPLEDYVAAALAGESGSFTYPESLKAMAIAIRTYAARFKPRHQQEGFDFCDSTHCQALNFKGISSQVRSALEATRGQLLWFRDMAAATFYHQNCGGALAGGKEAWPDLDAPYLQPHADPYCQRASLLPWKAQLNRQELEKALREQGLKVPPAWNQLEIAARSASGRVQKLVFRSANGPPQFVSASSLRFAIGRHFGWNQVRSDLYTLETTQDSIVFSGRGAGHGVGLCQAGAEQMAKEGMNYRQILEFYYPGTTVGLTAHGLQWEKRQSEHFELLTAGQESRQEEVLSLAENILAALESELGWKLDAKTQLKFYPTLDAYRNFTGQPGWIAAFTRGAIVSLQPLATLKSKSLLESTLRHEFSHRLIESHAHPQTPLWFREGLVLYLADPKQNVAPVVMPEKAIEAGLEHPADRQMLETSYAAARTRVGQMVQTNGLGAVLEWLTNGLPSSR